MLSNFSKEQMDSMIEYLIKLNTYDFNWVYIDVVDNNNF